MHQKNKNILRVGTPGKKPKLGAQNENGHFDRTAKFLSFRRTTIGRNKYPSET